MGLLVLGILLFTGVHLVPSLAPGLRGALVQRLGENGYKGLFSLSLLLGMGLIVLGWRSTLPSLVYLPPAGLYPLALTLMVLAFLLMVISGRPSRLKQVLRHPQLTGVFLWGLGHLLVNGEQRSVLLFGALALWAVVEMIAINRRDGAWVKPGPAPWSTDLISVVITGVVVAVVIFIHPWIAGVPVG